MSEGAEQAVVQEVVLSLSVSLDGVLYVMLGSGVLRGAVGVDIAVSVYSFLEALA